MNRKLSIVKSTLLTAALAVGVSGVAFADDSSNPVGLSESQLQAFSSDGPAWHPQQSVYDKSPSAWRQSNPGGLSERVLQSYSVWGEEWHLKRPELAGAPADPTFKQTHRNGLTERELQALSSSSESIAWKLPEQSATGTFASSGEISSPSAKDATDTGKPTLAQRFANLMHRLNRSPSQSEQ
jgi:hypothetical protein